MLTVPQEVPEVCEEPPGSSSDGDSLGCHHDATQPSFLCWGCSSAFPFVVINYRIKTATKVQGYAVKHSAAIEGVCHFYSPILLSQTITSTSTPLFCGPSMKLPCFLQFVLFPAALGMNWCGAMKEMLHS